MLFPKLREFKTRGKFGLILLLLKKFLDSEYDLINRFHIRDSNDKRDYLLIGIGKINLLFFSQFNKTDESSLIFDVKIEKNYYDNFKRNFLKFMEMINI